MFQHFIHSNTSEILYPQIKQLVAANLEVFFQTLCLSKIDASIPLFDFRKLTNLVSRRHASALVQLCTGHATIDAHLRRQASL